MTILVVPCEFSDWITNTKIPEFDRIVSTTCQECVKRIIITESALIKFDSVSMSLVLVIDGAQGLICVRIVNYQLFVRTTYDTDR